MNIFIICSVIIGISIILGFTILSIILNKNIKNMLDIFNRYNKDINSTLQNLKLVNNYQSNSIANTHLEEENSYETDMQNSFLELQSRAFDRPITSSQAKAQEFSSQDDDLEDLSDQLKGMQANGR